MADFCRFQGLPGVPVLGGFGAKEPIVPLTCAHVQWRMMGGQDFCEYRAAWTAGRVVFGDIRRRSYVILGRSVFFSRGRDKKLWVAGDWTGTIDFRPREFVWLILPRGVRGRGGRGGGGGGWGGGGGGGGCS